MTTPVAKKRSDYKTPEYTIASVNLDFLLHDQATMVTAISSVQRLSPQSEPLFLFGDSLKLVFLKIDGNDWRDYREVDGGLELNNVPASFELMIVTEIAPAENLAFEGLYKSGGAFCTQCEAEGFRRITYYLDRPDVSAVFTTSITAPKESYPYLLSNGNKVVSEDLPNGFHRVTWNDPFPKPSYLFALVAGDFDLLEDSFVTQSGRSVKLEIFVDRGNLNRAHHAMTSLKNAMRWDEERFGLEYDLDIYMIVAVGFFNMGAMENKGLNVFNDKFVLANSESATDKDYLDIEAVIGHEYFHNWTGNRVTCRDWFQLSLKEGLTVFRDQEFSSDLGSRAVNRIHNVRIMRNQQFAEDCGPMAHPIRPEEVIEMNNFYTVTVYEKGAEVIRMMHTLLGESKFQKGMKLYFDRHDGSAATCDDFVAAMEDASGIDLTQFRRWYSQAGTPELSVVTDYNKVDKTFFVEVTQETQSTAGQSEKLPLHIPFSTALYSRDGSRIPLIIGGQEVDSVLHIKNKTETFLFESVDEKPVISLLQEFSAPVKLHYEYADEELAFLMVHADNLFSRWDASQMLLGKHIRSMIASVESGMPVQVERSLVETFEKMLNDRETDPALAAEIFSLPSESEIAGWYATVPVDAIHEAISVITKTFAKQLKDSLVTRYNELTLSSYRIDHEDIAKRALRNRILHYIAFTDSGNDVVKAQFESADNMTDSAAALSAAVDAELPCAPDLLAQFDDRWYADGLVMDKWFLIQATACSSSTLTRVEELMNHRSFDFNNPNRLRSLVGAFAVHNQVIFHAIDGSGYRFLSEQLVKLNSSNPQVAARLIDPFLKFKRYDASRSSMMKRELEKLAKLDNLAKDLFEKITRALNA